MFRSPGPIAFALTLPPGLPVIGSLTLTIRWYGVLIATAMALGLWLASREAGRRGENPDDLLKTAELALIGGLIGARLYYVLFNLDYYRSQPWWRVLAVWEGGLAIHGGLIGGLLVGGVYARLRGLPLLTYLDVVAPSLAIGQAIGRWGNFFNEEAFGRPTTLPWKLYVSETHRPPEYRDVEYFHPTFLYESVWDLGVFAMLMLVFRRRFERAPGALFLSYLALYSVGRFWIEGLRTDSLMFGSIRVAQAVSLLAFALAVVGVPILLRRSRATAPARR
ncbi:MAG: prolipoprotein diacylglyceryl transferase [Candidatus Rokuibacteriota bacterium]